MPVCYERPAARWRKRTRGLCKASYPGSNPGRASKQKAPAFRPGLEGLCKIVFVIEPPQGALAAIVSATCGSGKGWRRHAIHNAALEDCNKRLGFTLPRKLKERKTQEASFAICAPCLFWIDLDLPFCF